MARGYTDLAMESSKISKGELVSGVEISRESLNGVEKVRVDVLNEQGERETGKRVGAYTTLYSSALPSGDLETRSTLRDALKSELSSIMGLNDDLEQDTILVLGLGNRNVTPDSLGPRAVGGILATRHLFSQIPEAVKGSMRRVVTSAPGVMGTTGVETSEVVLGLCQQLNPSLIIAIDALCARDLGRIATTIQVSNSGIQPGSGVGNHRSALDQASLGVKVVALGVPTVVYASTIVSDAFEEMGMRLEAGQKNMSKFLGESVGEMIVTPREIDSLVSEAAEIISDAVNMALHPGVSPEEMKWLTI